MLTVGRQKGGGGAKRKGLDTREDCARWQVADTCGGRIYTEPIHLKEVVAQDGPIHAAEEEVPLEGRSWAGGRLEVKSEAAFSTSGNLAAICRPERGS